MSFPEMVGTLQVLTNEVFDVNALNTELLSLPVPEEIRHLIGAQTVGHALEASLWWPICGQRSC